MKLGPYTIIERLSASESSLVARVETDSGETVLYKSLSEDPGQGRLHSLSRLKDVRCSHLRVPRIVEKDENGWFSVSRWLPGPSLETARQARFGGKVPLRQALVWLRHCLLALEVLHFHGLLHGDVKPSNLLLDENDQAVLVDLDGLQPIGETRVELATPEYLLLEAGERGTPRRDLYAATLTFFALLFGRLPESGEEVILASELDPLIPEAVNPLISKGRGPDQPYTTATEMLAAVDKLLGKEQRPASDSSTSPPTRRVAIPASPARPAKTLILASLLCFALGLGLAWVLKPAPAGPPPTLSQLSGITFEQSSLSGHREAVWQTRILGRPVACFSAPDPAYAGETAQDRATWTARVLQQVYFQRRPLNFEFRDESPQQSEVWLTDKGKNDLFVMRVTRSESELFDTPAPALARLWTRLIEDTFTLLGFSGKPGQAQGILLLRPWQARAEALTHGPSTDPAQKIANLREAFSSLKPDLREEILESFRPGKEKKKN